MQSVFIASLSNDTAVSVVCQFKAAYLCGA